jgi:hypothetical protein
MSLFNNLDNTTDLSNPEFNIWEDNSDNSNSPDLVYPSDYKTNPPPSFLNYLYFSRQNLLSQLSIPKAEEIQ